MITIHGKRFQYRECIVLLIQALINSGSRMQSCPKAGHTIVIKLHVRVASACIINMSDDGFPSLKQMIDFGKLELDCNLQPYGYTVVLVV